MGSGEGESPEVHRLLSLACAVEKDKETRIKQGGGQGPISKVVLNTCTVAYMHLHSFIQKHAHTYIQRIKEKC